jgi:cell fate regulator YaaT (PSP1 superfamily)
VDDTASQCRVVEVSFKQGSRKDFFRNPTFQIFEKGDYVTIEGVNGFDVGEVSLTGELVRMQLKKSGTDEFHPEIKKILRASTDKDIETFKISKGRESDMLAKSRAYARDLKLQMKLSEIELQADGKKGTFFYTADDRIDFRELIRMFAGEFKVKVEMRQIGIRQEAAKVGGIGSCGRELCCSTWLHDFKSVNTTAARYQNLSINQTKLSGQCGRLKCCLNFELDTYLDALQAFPDYADNLQTAMGTAFLIKKDIFKNLMWYTLPNNTKHFPLTIERVKEIKKLNQQGIAVEELEAVEITSKNKEVEPEFVELVGQISLRSLEKNDRRRRDQERNYRAPQGQNPNGPRPNNGPRPQGPNQNGPNGPRPNNGPRPQGTNQNGSNGPRPNNGPRPQGPNGPRPNNGPRPQGPNGPRPNNGPRPEGPRPEDVGATTLSSRRNEAESHTAASVSPRAYHVKAYCACGRSGGVVRQPPIGGSRSAISSSSASPAPSTT